MALLIAVTNAISAKAALMKDSDLNIQYSEDGRTAKLRIYNAALLFSFRVTVTDAKENGRVKSTVKPKHWSTETEYLELPCKILVESLPPANADQWAKTIEPRSQSGKSDPSKGKQTADKRDLLTEKPAPYDRVQMKNGDTVSGMIQNETLSIKTSYAILKFAPDKLVSIELEASGTNVDRMSLQVGDKLSGVLETPKITLKLTAGGEAEIDKDKIKLIRFRDKAEN